MISDPSYVDNLLTYGYDPRRRRFVLHGDIGHEDEHGKNAVGHCVNALLHLDDDPRSGDVNLWISTPGGPSEEMFGLYDVITTRSSRVVTTGFGLVASAGVLLLAAGDRRRATRNCWLMSHAEAADFQLDDTWTAQQRLAWQVRCEDRWAHLMHRRTGFRTERWWRELHKGKTRELWLDADQMLEYGIVDEIVEETL